MMGTNTLIIYNLQRTSIPSVSEELHKLELAGLVRWAQLRFLRRILAVFDDEHSAMKALPQLYQSLKAIEGAKGALLGFSYNNVERLHDTHLQLPDPGKLWFVSPPPSPPNEWVDSVEEGPNVRTHYEAEFNEQLMKALKAANEPETTLSTPITPVDPNRPFGPDSPRTVTILEAHENKPALQVTADDNMD